MPQSAEKVLDHAPLFREPEYQEMLKRKKRCSNAALDATKKSTAQAEYGPRPGNIARRTWRVNPWS